MRLLLPSAQVGNQKGTEVSGAVHGALPLRVCAIRSAIGRTFECVPADLERRRCFASGPAPSAADPSSTGAFPETSCTAPAVSRGTSQARSGARGTNLQAQSKSSSEHKTT